MTFTTVSIAGLAVLALYLLVETVLLARSITRLRELLAEETFARWDLADRMEARHETTRLRTIANDDRITELERKANDE